MKLLIKRIKEYQRNFATIAESKLYAINEFKYLLHSLNNYIIKLKKYQDLINESSAYIVAVMIYFIKR